MHRPLRCVLSQTLAIADFSPNPASPIKQKQKQKSISTRKTVSQAPFEKGRPEKQRFSVVAE
jgi:hypothetical protein